MQSLTQPTLLLKPFASSGDKNTIPDVNSDVSNPQLADLTNGFPQITSETPDNGGLPPERKDFNGLGYLTTTYDYYYQAGGTFTYNPTIATAIGGYPQGARLWYTDSNGISCILRSTIDDNTNNFLNDPSVIGVPSSGKPWVVENFRGIMLNTQYVSNCITEIPQDIKLELSSGTLTLKSGSVLTAPDGTQLQIIADKSYTIPSTIQDGKYAVFASRNSGNLQGPILVDKIASGPASSRPTWSSSIAGGVYFSTDTLKISLAGGASWTDDWTVALPIALITVTSSVITSIDQVFNGVGYMGSTVFGLPGLKCLVPNGRNEDGTLKNTNATLSSLVFVTSPSNLNGNYWIRLGNNYVGFFTSTTHYYSDSNFVIYNGNIQSQAMCGRVVINNGVIGSLELEPVFHAVDYYDAAIKWGDNTFTGNNTFSGSVSLGSSATATTPGSSDNDTSVATSAFGQTLFANAIGTPRDVTVLWGNGSVVNTPGALQLSEAFTNFEQIGILCCQDAGNFRTIRVISTYWLNYLLTQTPANNTVGLWSEGSSLCSLFSYSYTINPSTNTYLSLSSENNGFVYVFGINRKKTTVPDPLA